MSIAVMSLCEYEPEPKSYLEILDDHISDKEVEMIEAFRKLSYDRQNLFFHKMKYQAIEYKTDEPRRCKIGGEFHMLKSIKEEKS